MTVRDGGVSAYFEACDAVPDALPEPAPDRGCAHCLVGPLAEGVAVGFCARCRRMLDAEEKLARIEAVLVAFERYEVLERVGKPDGFVVDAFKFHQDIWGVLHEGRG